MTALKLHVHDNVATVLKEVETGESVSVLSDEGEIVETIMALGLIPQNHKVALRPIKISGDVVKFGEVIGRATESIRQGEHVHIHNVASKRVGGL